MSTVTIVIIFLGGIMAGAAVLYVFTRRSSGLVMLQNQMNEIARSLDHRLGESTRLMHAQFGESARIIENVTEKLTKLDETNRQVMNLESWEI